MRRCALDVTPEVRLSIAASATLGGLPADKFLSREEIKPRHQRGGIAHQKVAGQLDRFHLCEAVGDEREQSRTVDSDLPYQET